jgi:hypothetical protein
LHLDALQGYASLICTNEWTEQLEVVSVRHDRIIADVPLAGKILERNEVRSMEKSLLFFMLHLRTTHLRSRFSTIIPTDGGYI